MPTPRISGAIARQASKGPGIGARLTTGQPGSWREAIVMGVFGDLNNRVYVAVEGLTVQALMAIDAPLKVGDRVLVVYNAAAQEWLVVGTT